MKYNESVAGLPAELIVAGKMAATGWNIYSPHRDLGIDFIATRICRGRLMIRPVQVKGCYFKKRKDSHYYGRTDMVLNQIHDEMVLAIPYFFPDDDDKLSLQLVAYLPLIQLHKRKSTGTYRALPAKVKDGRPQPRRDFAKFFDDPGLKSMEKANWNETELGKEESES